MAGAKGEVVRLYRPGKCAICGKPTVQKYHPFCSKRCADEDLGRWLTGRYAIPGAEIAEDSKPTDADEET